MKKIILFTFLIVNLLFSTQTVYAQSIFDFNKSVPGVGCGVAGDTTGKDICCNIQSNFQCNQPIFTTLQGFLGLIPGVGNAVSQFLVKCQGLQSYVQSNNNNPCLSGQPTTSNYSDPSCKCIDPVASASASPAIALMCYKYLTGSSSPNELSNCLKCSAKPGLWTGIGCLSLDVQQLITGFILNLGVGLGGGFALLCIIYSAFMMQSSQGNPEKLKKAQENLTSCIMGLILIIFSVFILRLVGVTILGIPFLS
ncbi:hypothetical protein COY87_04620 [Candidatus Roizmanbacteria bacterium CG_4_10_14_0_8_um_filter_33_9]|uniref:Vitamin K epoxide reductase domain-containing protein n=1 Tax=Candidatus Roizmanbacteria bacterium CG_4_10_14_0_8_um_filter_33_9 TaxID=1974826 RepID=A0A2M7QHD0_9BACT|nr:MAG: hypothetical protein COY87_04620 [Candidatus Roizmanbacteria bacterium CG_4_10_14_0_8_um_filter_33_9]